MSYVLKKERCPACKERGVDRSGDNLAVYSDGHQFCFACGYYQQGSLSSRINKASEDQILVLPSFSEDHIDLSSKEEPEYSPVSSWPKNVRDWLSKYGITSKEIHDNRIYWDQEQQRLCFPIYYGHILQVTQGRYFGSDPNQPKYSTYGPKSKYYKICISSTSNLFPCMVITEDYLSAIKVSRVAQSLPLLGSHFNQTLTMALLGRCSRLRIWLDFDKAQESIRLAARTRQYIPDCGTIITEKDPKDYTTMEIKEIVGSSLSSNSKGMS